MNPTAQLVESLLVSKVSKWVQNPKFTIAFRDEILNEAQQIFIEICADLAQENSRVEEDIRLLRKSAEPLSVIRNTNTATWFELPSDYFRLNRLHGTIACPECPAKPIRRIFRVKINEESHLVHDTLWKPNWDFATTFYSLDSEGIKAYHNSAFSYTELFADYYRKPVEFRSASSALNRTYESFAGNIVDFDSVTELTQNYQLRRITDIAAVICERNMGDAKDWELKVKSITVLENLYK